MYAIAVLAAIPLAAVLGPWWLRQTQGFAHAESFASMARLLGAMALAAISATLGNLFYPFSESAQLSPLRLMLQLVLGDYIGMLVLVPLVMMLFRERPDTAMLRRWRFDVPVVLLPVLLAYLALVARSSESQVFFFSALLCSVPSIYFAVRSGWRGAALALSVASIAIAYSGWLDSNPGLTVEAQGFLAVVGSATLLLGAVRDALRDSQRELLERNAGLLAANERQDRIAGELRDAARRNLEMSEEIRRWITSELHDEIGQNLAALQARVRLLERQAGAEGSELTGDIATTLTRMRQTVSGLMSSLRPAGLDDFGLAFSLREGAIRGTVEAAGLVYDLRIDAADACLNRLDSNAQTTLYRIVQEAATNTIRHAHATRLSVRLRARGEANDTRVLLAITDDGHGFDISQRAAGIGLLGIRDRVLAIGGWLRMRSGVFGTRLQVRVQFPRAAAATPRNFPVGKTDDCRQHESSCERGIEPR
jgi:two-component system sensor histidine kinase UhpB